MSPCLGGTVTDLSHGTTWSQQPADWHNEKERLAFAASRSIQSGGIRTSLPAGYTATGASGRSRMGISASLLTGAPHMIEPAILQVERPLIRNTTRPEIHLQPPNTHHTSALLIHRSAVSPTTKNTTQFPCQFWRRGQAHLASTLANRPSGEAVLSVGALTLPGRRFKRNNPLPTVSIAAIGWPATTYGRSAAST